MGVIIDDGNKIREFKRSFLPKGEITRSGFKTHGKTRDILDMEGARPFCREDVVWINTLFDADRQFNGNYWTIAHNYDFDRQVLTAAFKSIGANLPKWNYK